jgi:hypothetical protein
MPLRNNNFGKFFGPTFAFTGYALIIAGLFAVSYSLTALFLVIPGMFIAFTYTGTIIDTENKRVKPYTSLFGFIRTGKWIGIDRFSRFSIEKSTSRYTAYSRANIRFDMNISNINLILLNHEGNLKVVLNKHSNFEDARKEKEELSEILFPGNENTDLINNKNPGLTGQNQIM